MAKVPVYFDVRSVVQGLSDVASLACKNLANNTRERTVKYIMGGRKADNPFEQNVVLSSGKYKKSSVARPYPGSPRSYKKPGNPGGCLAVVQYAKQKTDKIPIPPVSGSRGLSIRADRFITGPIGNGNQKTPRKLELGGTSSSYYKIVKNPKGKVVRWEFANAKPQGTAKRRMQGKGGPHSKNKDGTLKYASWAEVNAVMRARGQKVGGRRTSKVVQQSAPDPKTLGFQGPKTFRVRKRPYVTRAWNEVKKKSHSQVRKAAKDWPRKAKKYLSYIGG